MWTISTIRASALLLALGIGFGTLAGCSFVVESRDKQCTVDSDCSGFGDAICDVAGGVCVARGTTSTGPGGGADCAGPDGCYACAPEKQEEFLNACTDVDCVPYDNTPLEGLLNPDGTVPAVP